MPRAAAAPIRGHASASAASSAKAAKPRAAGPLSQVRLGHDRLAEVLTVAEQRGLLSGTRTQVVRGRMPAGLVAEAKLRSGIFSDSKLLEAALANLAVADDYAEWLIAQRGTIDPELDLEF